MEMAGFDNANISSGKEKEDRKAREAEEKRKRKEEEAAEKQRRDAARAEEKAAQSKLKIYIAINGLQRLTQNRTTEGGKENTSKRRTTNS